MIFTYVVRDRVHARSSGCACAAGTGAATAGTGGLSCSISSSSISSTSSSESLDALKYVFETSCGCIWNPNTASGLLPFFAFSI
jgi:hypothetical protein